MTVDMGTQTGAAAAAAYRLDKVIDQMSGGATPQQVLTELVRIRGVLGVLPEPKPERLDGDDVLRAGAQSLAAAVEVLQSRAVGTADQIVHLRALERALRDWIGTPGVPPRGAAQREQAIALATALRVG